MNTNEKLAAILAAVQTDPGSRGLARDPHDNLFTATVGHFAAACRSIAEHAAPRVIIFTGFWIPSATPPAFETDGPLGSECLRLAFKSVGIPTSILCEAELRQVFGVHDEVTSPTHIIACERPGPTADGTFRTMRARDISHIHGEQHKTYERLRLRHKPITIGIGDGGNEVGMGAIPQDVIKANIPNGTLVHCVTPVDHLIVAGVSNWGAYALAAGVALMRNQVFVVLPLFDLVAEQQRLAAMVEAGPLVDGVRGCVQATVDGLSEADYFAPFVHIREILQS